jgi:outer membrane protein assembly factor BamB
VSLRDRSRITLVAVLAATLTFVVSPSAHASSGWPQPGHDGGSSNDNADEHVLTPSRIGDLVHLRTLHGWALGTPALVADGDLLSGLGNDLVRRSFRGSVLWRSAVCSPSNVMIEGDTVVINDDTQMGCAAGSALSWTTGEPTWDTGQLSFLAADDGLLVASDLQGDAESDVWDSLDLVAVDAATGAERWRIERPGDAPWTSAARLQDGRLLVAFADGRVTSLDPATGEELWSWSVPDGRRIRLTALVGDTALVVRTHHAGGDRAVLVALDATDGSVRWRRLLDRGIDQSVAAGDGRVYADLGRRLLALSIDDGERLWSTTVPDRSSFGGSSLIGAAGVLYADLNSPGDIVMLDAADGERLGRIRHYGWPSVAAGRLVAIGTDDYGIGVFGLLR